MTKVALVTGCSSGIGLATAIELAKNGYITYASMRNFADDKNPLPNSDKKDKVEAEALKADVKVNIIQLDISDDESVSKAFKQVMDEQGRIDVLVNNAGYGYFGSVESTSIDEFKEQFETDFYGAVRTIQNAIPIMREQKSIGHIINISSVAGFMGFPVVAAYVTCRFALEGLTESLRQELYEKDPKKRIHVVLIEPGIVNTNFMANMKEAKRAHDIPQYKEIIENFMKYGMELMKNSMEPEKVAKKIIYVLQEEEPEPRYRIGYDADQWWSDKLASTPLEFEEIIRGIVSDLQTPQKT